MDSLTHIAIGACIGDLFLGKKIGKVAMLYGAVAASLPDIDFVASFWLSTSDDLLAHRGFTHSFLFALLVILVLAFAFRHRHRVDDIPVSTWLMFMGACLFSHLFLDVFNAYGIGWLEPFSHHRFSFNTLFVADPFFSCWPAAAAIALLIVRREHKKRNRWAIGGLLICFLYLGYCVFHKLKLDTQMRSSLALQHIPYIDYFTTPTPFNNWLWYTVAKSEAGYYIGYRSVFDKETPIRFHFFPRNDSLLTAFNGQEECEQLKIFSQGYYTAAISPRGVVFNDLRFGQMLGWQNPEADFVFHYYMQDPAANSLVVQRGRFAHWNRETIRFFLKRIAGN